MVGNGLITGNPIKDLAVDKKLICYRTKRFFLQHIHYSGKISIERVLPIDSWPQISRLISYDRTVFEAWRSLLFVRVVLSNHIA